MAGWQWRRGAGGRQEDSLGRVGACREEGSPPVAHRTLGVLVLVAAASAWLAHQAVAVALRLRVLESPLSCRRSLLPLAVVAVDRKGISVAVVAAVMVPDGLPEVEQLLADHPA